MSQPTTQAGIDGLDAIANNPRRALLAFDFDGVLSPIVDDPEQAQTFPRVLSALARIGQKVGSVSIITGRPVSFLISRDGFDTLSSIHDLTVYGHYGNEKWDVMSHTTVSAPVSTEVVMARKELTRLLEQPGIYEGLWLEDKGSAVAVHTRRATDPVRALAMLTGPVNELARRHNLRVEPGKMVLEIRPDGVHKGDVLREIIRERAIGAVLYAGDDLGDLSAFAIIDELRENGIPGIKVCSGSAEAREVADAADIVVDGPVGVAGLLECLTSRIERQATPDAVLGQ